MSLFEPKTRRYLHFIIISDDIDIADASRRVSRNNRCRQHAVTARDWAIGFAAA